MDMIFTPSTIGEAAAQLLSAYPAARVFAFDAPMGAGKTTFIHALCGVLKVTDMVSSPTFPIINVYNTVTGEEVYHIDLYRLADTAEAVQAGVEDCLFSGAYCFVEWPGRAPGILPPGAVDVVIQVVDGHTRRLRVMAA